MPRLPRNLLAMASFVAVPAFASVWLTRPVTAEWTWFEDYVYATDTYVVACQPNRRCQVGMGIFAFGEPRGEKIRFSGEREVTVIGVGSIHIRSDDGDGVSQAAIYQKDSRALKTPPISW